MAAENAGSFRIIVDLPPRVHKKAQFHFDVNDVIKRLRRNHKSLRQKSWRENTNEYEEKTIDYDMEAISEDWRLDLLRLASDFTQTVVGKKYLLQIAQDSFLEQQFSPVNEKMSVKRFAFGNMTDPFTFLTAHREEQQTDDNSFTILANFLKDRTITKGMLVSFEHDRDILFLRFVYFQPANPISVFVVTLKLRYIQIRRLIVNLFREKGSEHKQATIYFCLNYPIEVRRAQMMSGKGKNVGEFGSKFARSGRDGERCLMWRTDDEVLKGKISDSSVFALTLDDYEDNDLYNVLSRLRLRSKKVLEFTYVSEKPAPVHVKLPREDHFLRNKLYKLNDYSVSYFVDAIFSRGSIVKDVILNSDDSRNKFIHNVCQLYYKNPLITQTVLDQFLGAIDERRELRDPFKLWELIVRRVKSNINSIQKAIETNQRDGYILVRKIIVTPTRILLMSPESIMGNRGLRDFARDGDDAIRVQFRDEDGMKMRKNSVGEGIITEVVGKVLEKGLEIAGRRFGYLCSSNSQLRDNGCYFFKEDRIKKIRERMGHFNEEMSVPKRMSRMGQFFTQAQRVQRPLKTNEFLESYDFIGGSDIAGKPYTFSDGVGMMSYEFAKEISENLRLNGCVPSCFQIRYRGFKGVLSVHPMMDEWREWAKKNIDDPKARSFCNNNVIFRDSQKKFHAPKSSKHDHAPFEVVKYSAPCIISLNRPMIDILDQVSEMQSYSSHERIHYRIHELFEAQVARAANSLTSERNARERLAEMPKRVGISQLQEEHGFLLTEEPFFRTLVMSSVRQSLKKLRTKNSIEIPSNMGRMVFGIVDESGQLQYNQVFCQISNNTFIKHPKKSALKTVLKGPVLMTKNPAIVKGDIRVFTAVDVRELRHLVDVIVFSRYGPRPQPDEMAGSDLDGDEYVIIWDEKFLFERNEEAMDFPRPTPPNQKVPQEEIEKRSREFVVKYIIQDAVGMLANAFLANSDFYGIDSEVCAQVAFKHAQALDFPKTGEQPEALTKMSTDSNRFEGKRVPPEKPDRYPDFMEKDHQRSYASVGLNGQIYRRARDLDNIVHKSIGRQLNEKIELDPDLIIEGWEQYEEDALKTMEEYNSQMRNIIETFGIEDEGQLFSGAIVSFKSRVGDATQESDLFGAYNMGNTVSRSVTSIFHTARRQFFDKENFGGYLACTENSWLNSGADEKDEIHKRICETPNLKMRQIASAYYKVTYETAQQQSQPAAKFLSFPWTVWDILAAIKRDAADNKRRDMKIERIRGLDPFSSCLSTHIAAFCAARSEDHEEFLEILDGTDPIIRKMIRWHRGLSDLMFFLCVWADDAGVFDSVFTYQHFCWLLILFGLNKFQWKPGKNFPLLTSLEDFDEETMKKLDLGGRFGGIGSIAISFLEFLSSHFFSKLIGIDFQHLGANFCLEACYLKRLREAAVLTYNEVTFSVSFDSLPQADESAVFKSAREFELDAFMIELPHAEDEAAEKGAPRPLRYHLAQVENAIKEKTGASHVRLRRSVDVFQIDVARIMVSAKGTLEALQKVQTLLTVMPTGRSEKNFKFGRFLMAEQLLVHQIGVGID